MDQQVFEEQLDEDYDPTPEEIADYAKWLGLDPATDSHLLWIAREGLKAPLPEEWKPCRSPEQGLYYYNFVTGQSSWEHPSDSYYKKLFQEEKCKPAHPAQAGLAPAQKQQLFAGNGAGRSASSGSIFAGSAACQGFSGPVAALFGAGSVPASMPGTRPGTAQQHASWDARQLRRQQPSGLASNFLGRQLSAGSRHDLTGGAASVGSSMAPSPRRVSESASFAARMSTQTSGHFEDVRKPGTAPASGAKKVTWQDLVSTDPQPTAVVPKPRPAPLAVTTPNAVPFAVATQRPGGMAPSMEGGSMSAAVPGSRTGVSSYAQQMQVYRAKLAAAAAAATATTEDLDGGSSREAVSGGGGHIPTAQAEGTGARAVRSDAAHESSGSTSGDTTTDSMPQVVMEASVRSGAAGGLETSEATGAGVAKAGRELPRGGASHSQQIEMEQPSFHKPSCASLPGEETSFSQGASLVERESSAAVSVQSSCQTELQDCSLHSMEPGSGMRSRQAPTASLDQANSDSRCPAEGQPLQHRPGRIQAAGDCLDGGEGQKGSSSSSLSSADSTLEGSSGGNIGGDQQPPNNKSSAATVLNDGSTGARPRAEGGIQEPGPESSGMGELDHIMERRAKRSSLGQTPHGGAVCAGLPARQKELEEAPAEDHPAAAPAASAAALSELASQVRGQQGLVLRVGGFHADFHGQTGGGEAVLHIQPQVPAQAAGTASDDDADMLECRLAAAATAAATKAHTALLREQALKQKQEASEARLEMQLKMDARHMDAISQSMRSMKENVRQIQQLEHQGRQLSKAVGLQHESGALVTGILTAATAGATTMLSGPGATGMAAWERVSEPAGRSCEGGAAEQLEVERDLDGRMEQCLRQLQHALLQLTGP